MSELTEEEDDVVVFEESGGGQEDDQDGETEKDAEEEGGSTGDGRQYEINYLSDLSQLQSHWQCKNHQSLGELWFRMLM